MYNETVGYDYDTEGAVLFELLSFSFVSKEKNLFSLLQYIFCFVVIYLKFCTVFRAFTQKANWARHILKHFMNLCDITMIINIKSFW